MWLLISPVSISSFENVRSPKTWSFIKTVFAFVTTVRTGVVEWSRKMVGGDVVLFKFRKKYVSLPRPSDECWKTFLRICFGPIIFQYYWPNISRVTCVPPPYCVAFGVGQGRARWHQLYHRSPYAHVAINRVHVRAYNRRLNDFFIVNVFFPQPSAPPPPTTPVPRQLVFFRLNRGPI